MRWGCTYVCTYISSLTAPRVDLMWNVPSVFLLGSGRSPDKSVSFYELCIVCFFEEAKEINYVYIDVDRNQKINQSYDCSGNLKSQGTDNKILFVSPPEKCKDIKRLDLILVNVHVMQNIPCPSFTRILPLPSK